jgi:hypothetical protein
MVMGALTSGLSSVSKYQIGTIMTKKFFAHEKPLKPTPCVSPAYSLKSDRSGCVRLKVL